MRLCTRKDKDVRANSLEEEFFTCESDSAQRVKCYLIGEIQNRVKREKRCGKKRTCQRLVVFELIFRLLRITGFWFLCTVSVMGVIDSKVSYCYQVRVCCELSLLYDFVRFRTENSKVGLN